MKRNKNEKKEQDSLKISRRNFIKGSSAAVAGASIVAGLGPKVFSQSVSGVSIVTPSGDEIANSSAPQWAVSALQEALEAQNVTVNTYADIAQAAATDVVIVVESNSSSLPGLPPNPESLGLAPVTYSGRAVLLATGSDARGLVYAVLEIKDRVEHSDSLDEALNSVQPIVERPANNIRSMKREFVSELNDKPWFNDQEYWSEYLTLLATHRINRVNLGLGMGYNFTNPALNAQDSYFCFAFPFFVSVDGVSVSDLPAAERNSNLAQLKWISDEAAKRGIHFQLGMWCMSNKLNSPKYKIQGGIQNAALAGPVHAAYCRDALSRILTECPNINGMTFRTHWESGIPVGSFDFWGTVYEAFTPFINQGRSLEVDMHGKEVKPGDIDAGVASGVQVVVSPKRWFEFCGIPYHQAWIREQERYNGNDVDELGRASRYGYSNYYRESRRFKILHRVWPGTQKFLLWADPVYASAYGRSSSFCGSQGIEWCEPLSFKGRQLSGQEGSRCGYKEEALNPDKDFQKYDYYYRIWGRLLYNPDADPDTWQRYLRKEFGAAATNIELGVGAASRVLMLATTMHMAAPGAQKYWPEVYINYSIIEGQPQYQDSDNPLRETSSGDPQLIMEVGECAEALVSGDFEKAHKYTPIDFCQLLEDSAAEAETNITAAKSLAPNSNSPEYRRVDIDTHIQLNLGYFFGYKFRAGVLWSIYRKTNDNNAKAKAVEFYEKALEVWETLADIGSVYQDNISYGNVAIYIKGHWSDRIARIKNDIAAMKAKTHNTVTAITTHPGDATEAIAYATGRPTRPEAGATHIKPFDFVKGQALTLTLSGDETTTAVRLYYRHVSQAVGWESRAMTKSGTTFTASIPASYTQTDYPLQYYFGVDKSDVHSMVFPGFDELMTNQPYYVVRAEGVVVKTDNLMERHPLNALSGLVVRQNGRTVELQYMLNRGVKVSAKLYDLRGKSVGSFAEEYQKAGSHRIGIKFWGGRSASGRYVVKVTADGAQSTEIIELK